AISRAWFSRWMPSCSSVLCGRAAPRGGQFQANQGRVWMTRSGTLTREGAEDYGAQHTVGPEGSVI
ncbi:hypothetical protein, partial [Streptomyces microflavus]|uniref:hypothetical protein n=1 Tax=Streptomyces microflavus TaxID=1919 RepID=UPI0033B8660F